MRFFLLCAVVSCLLVAPVPAQARPSCDAYAYAGVQNVSPDVRDAAFGMGMTGPQVLWRVELPNALPLIIGGVRSAVLQVISTATIAAYVGLGGLGRYIFDGLAQRGVLVRAGAALGRAGALRVTYGTPQQNQRFLDALRDLL